MTYSARRILFAFCLIGGLASTAMAQSPQPLEIDIGFKLAQYPQVGIQILPTSRFELGLAAYTENGIVDRRGRHSYGLATALMRLGLKRDLSFRVGANYAHNFRLDTHFLGPLFGFDYVASEDFRIFADFALGIGLNTQRLYRGNTGIGLSYRIKR